MAFLSHIYWHHFWCYLKPARDSSTVLLLVAVLFFISSKSLYARPTITLAAPDIAAQLAKNDGKGRYIEGIIEEALHRSGYNFNLVTLPYERSLKMSNEGLVDGEVARSPSIEPQYPNLIRVPESILDIDIVVISREPVDLSDGWNALAGKSIGVLTGMKATQQYLPETVHLITVKNTTQLIDMLLKNRVDYVVFMRSIGISILGGDRHGLIVNARPLATVPNYTYLHKKHKNLVPGLAQSLREMKQDGTFQQIVEKYMRGGNSLPCTQVKGLPDSC